MNKKLLLSLVAVAVIAAATTMGTIAYFSDKETSKDNSFVAGTIDLKVADADMSVNGPVNNTQNWSATDLTSEKFFNFSDVKPGDFGSDRIELTVQSNPAYVCSNINITAKDENGVTNPETKANDSVADGIGELQKYVSLFVWADTNCNNAKDGEEAILFNDKLSTVGANGASFYAGIVNPDSSTASGKLCIAKKWCVGNFDANGGCDGSGDQNDAQGDSVKADISFYAMQTRHNTQPTDCSVFFNK